MKIISNMADDETACSGDAMTTVASRIASICAMIEDHEAGGETLSARRVAAVSAMIYEVAQGMPRGTTRKRRMGNASCYEQVRKLGEGTFGVVFQARHRATGQSVAVKALRCERSDYQHFVVRNLLREACIMAACGGHPSLVALRGVVRTPPGATGRRDYSLVMEFAGPSLSQVLDERMISLDGQGQPFTEAEVRCIVRQLLSGAAAMHRHGIMHRDIKPSNILVPEDGGDGGDVVVKIGDYGAAMRCTAEQDPEEYRAAGTWVYSAPEMLLEKPGYDTRVDAWSIGCVMAELLTGDLLFRGDGIADILQDVFELLGVPSESEWGRAFNSPLFDKEVKQWRELQRRNGGRRNYLRELFPKTLLSRDGFRVLQGLLTCNPSRRLDAAAALRCPWFAVPVTGAPNPQASALKP